jgi:hypothetical protein
MDEQPRQGEVSDIAILDLTGMRTPEDLAGITRIHDVALILVPESLAGALARIPTHDVASVVPVPEGSDVAVHAGAIVLGGEALANPPSDDAVLVVTGSLALSSPVREVRYRRVVVTGMVLAPYGSEAALGAGLSRLTGSIQYYEHVEGQRFRTLSGQTRISGTTLANAGGNPADILFLSGQTIITSPPEQVGFQHVVAAGQLVAPREAEAVLAPVLTIEGQLVWYSGNPRFLVGREHVNRDFLELVEEPLSLAIVGVCRFDDDVPPALLREKVAGITLAGKIVARTELHGVLQLLTVDKHGVITADTDDGEG